MSEEEKKKHPGGRPRKPIDRQQFENLCSMQCTLAEIASWFDCSKPTIIEFCRREYGEEFSTVWAQKAEKGKISLRRKQFKLAEKSPAMAIFLGKNILGQKDVQRNELVGDENQPIVTEGTFKVNVYLPDNGRD